MPVSAEQILEPPRPSFIHPLYVIARGFFIKPFPSRHLRQAKLYGSRKMHFEDMADFRKELGAAVAVVDKLPVPGYLAHGGLEGNAIKPQAFPPLLPPVRLSLENFRVPRFGNPIAAAGFDEHFSVNAAVTQD